jgi:hypothetical protein
MQIQFSSTGPKLRSSGNSPALPGSILVFSVFSVVQDLP